MRHVGIVGAGISGLALAALLCSDGWRVTVLERSNDDGPVGAGFMLQQLGQQVADRLGIGAALLAGSSPIRTVDGRRLDGRPTMQVRYDDVVPGVMAWGVHRSTLFDLLHGTANDAGAQVVPDFEVQHVERRGARGWTVRSATGQHEGPFDLLVGADGASSQVRRLAFSAQMDRPYPWGALWAIVPDPTRSLGSALVQRWGGTRITLGLMPTGVAHASIFWSIRARDIERAIAAGPQAFIDLAAPIAGSCAPLVEEVARTGLLGARYRDVVVRVPVQEGAVLVGDAAHAMSPQLGIGASMGLADAWTLAWALREYPHDSRDALAEYVRQRARHVRYYRWLSMLMTPVFQSGLTPIAPARDLGLVGLSHNAFAQRQMVSTLMGERTSPWSRWALPG